MTDYLAEALLGVTVYGTPFTAPATVYLALYTDATTDAGGGTEVVGGSYARQPVTFATTGDPHAAENTDALAFADMPAVTVTNAAVMDDPTAGNMLYHGPLVAPKTSAAGDTVNFAVGDVDLDMS